MSRHEVVGATHMYSFSSGQSNSTMYSICGFHLGRSVYSHLCHHFSAAHPLGFWWKKLQGRHRPFPSLDIAKDSSFQAIHRHSTSPGCIHYITQSHLDFWDQNDQAAAAGWPPGAYWGHPNHWKMLRPLPGPFFNNLLFTCSVHIDKCDTLWYSMIFEQWIKVN